MCDEQLNRETIRHVLARGFVESDGTWVAKLVLDEGKSYRFRYHDNQGRWLSDNEADAYVSNDFGSDDSVLDLMMVARKPSKAKATKKAATPKGSPGNLRKIAGGRKAKPKR